jgi:hypothetical protein
LAEYFSKEIEPNLYNVATFLFFILADHGHSGTDIPIQKSVIKDCNKAVKKITWRLVRISFLTDLNLRTYKKWRYQVDTR